MSFQFLRSERLKSRLVFSHIAENGVSVRKGAMRLRSTNKVMNGHDLQVAFTVPKRNIKRAVERNRIKRQMREIFRHLKPELYVSMKDASVQASFLFVYQGKEPINTEAMRSTMRQLLKRWIEVHACVDS